MSAQATLESSACLGDDEVLLLVEGKLPDDARDAVEAHLDACAACRRLVGAAAPADDARSPGAGGAAERTLARGTSIGRYLVLSLLGHGGMGVVYAAYDAELDRRVAVKLLHTARDSDQAQRLLVREARALGRLSHPNVVQVHDVGEHEGDVFVAMELVEGKSLDAWCRSTPRPGWRAVLAAYLDAARGLAAAHEKGLVHRDVKPSNILRGDDGRVRVADFGLASGREQGRAADRREPGAIAAAIAASPPTTPALDDTVPLQSRDESPLEPPLTRTGVLVGTPLYMAPEQHRGLRATAASDQYSFSVALHEGLYGSPPFTIDRGAKPAAALALLLEQKEAGPPAAPPSGAMVPPWIHRAIARSLSPRPEDRHPSMQALIAALSDDPDARRGARLRRAGIGAAAAALLAVAAGGWARSGAFRDPCADPEKQLAQVWDDDVRGRVRAAFLGTGRPHAEGTVTRVVAEIDRYAAAWSSMRGEVCRASHGGGLRAPLATLRDACLDRRRGQLKALTTLFADKPDPDVLDRAVRATAELPPLAYCADTEALTARVRPPEDPALRARVAELEPRVDRLEALRNAGKYQDGLALGEPLLADVEAIPHAPLRAQVRFRMGQLRDGTGDYEGAKALLRGAAVAAAEGKDDVLVLNAWAWLLFVVAEHQHRLEEASTIEALGASVVARAADERSQSNWLNSVGLLQTHLGKREEAKATYERALAIKERVLGPDQPDIIAVLNNLGNALFAMGDYAGATRAYERAHAVSEKIQGPEHPDVAHLLYNLANTNDIAGHWPQALALHERALAIRERALHENHPVLASTLSNMCSTLMHLGDHARARAACERALAIKEKALGKDSYSAAFTLTSLGRTEVRLAHLDAALTLLERARAIMEKARGASSHDLAEPLLGLGELALAEGHPERALPLLERAAPLADDHALRGEIQLTRAGALWQIGKDRPRARALAEEARAAYQRIAHAPGQDQAARWLAAHPIEGAAPPR